MNQTVITGKCWQPEIKYGKTGTCIAEVSVSIYDGKDQSGKGKYFSVKVKAFKELAEKIGNEVNQGDYLQVIGRLTEEKWKKDGNTQRRLVLIADSIGKELNKFSGGSAGTKDGFAAMGKDVTDDDQIPF